jgi:transposase
MERLHMNHLKDILHRLRSGESERRIAHDLQISRPTVHKYTELAKRHGFVDPERPMPDQASLMAALGPGPQPPKMISSLEPHRAVVEDLLKQGLEKMAIWQRLRDNYGYGGSYSSVRRFVSQLGKAEPEAYTRVHTIPGEEMQVDFGTVGQLYDPEGGRIRTAYVFVATLGYSRHQYAELVFDQKVTTWIALHRRAFEWFGGVVKRVVPDNLKAGVIQALVYDPVLGEAYRKMALHYGFLISPTRPATPRHKGKVENGVHYVQRNFWAGQEFADIMVANQHLRSWVKQIAGVRQHGTTHQAPLALFGDVEQAALQPLPSEPFALCEVRTAKLHPDCHVVVAGSYYSAPYRLVGQQLDVYVHERVVELYHYQELVATHLRCQAPGQWQTRLEDYPPYKAAYLQRTPQVCREQAAQIGSYTTQVTEQMLNDRPLDRLRSVQAILRLADSVGASRLEAACERALYYGDVSYRRIKGILNAALDREPLPDQPHPLPVQAHTFARPGATYFVAAEEVAL